MIRYCKSCVYPSTKPGISFSNDQVCGGCQTQIAKRSIDWNNRISKLKEKLHHNRTPGHYDCVIPISGGKDSHLQVYYIKEVLGLNPLCVSVMPQVPTEVGTSNLENLVKRFKVDLIRLQAQHEIERKLTVAAFKRYAWPNWAHDKLIYTWPIRISVNMNIKYVIMGENHDFENGGRDLGEGALALNQMKNTLGNDSMEAMIDSLGVDPADSLPYRYPPVAEIDRSNTEVIWLGHYVNWDSFDVYQKSISFGFQSSSRCLAGNIESYSGIDDKIVMMNAWLKFIKFGYSRVSDVCFNHISAGRMSRRMAVELVNEHEGILDETLLSDWLKYTGLDRWTFEAIVEKHANHDIVEFRNGRWALKAPVA